MKVAIIGAGLQCKRRAPVLKESPGVELAVIASRTLAEAQAMAQVMGCEAASTWQDVIARKDIDIVLVCTPPHVHAEISIAAMRHGKHVLCEKPLSRTVAEAMDMLAVAKKTGRILKCGFNHRHHPAVWEAKRLTEQGKIGTPIFGRCRYGICGRPGYEKEWRADPDQAAGGQFIEQGTHAIDLFRWFLGEITEVACMTSCQYFTQQKLEEGGMAIFRSKSGATASLHTSLTEWKNQFSFEIFGEDGYVIIEGLGASYGIERLTVGKRDFTAPFSYDTVEYRGGDVSWKEEWKEFTAAIRDNRQPIGNATDGLAAMRIALAAYESEKTGRIVKIN